MKFSAIAAIIACKLSRFAIRILRRGGTAMPGRIALKICPELLSLLSKNVKTVVITGTNGKTTSARMIEKAFEDEGRSYLANRSGANLISGITTEFALNSTIFGRCKKEYAIIECDEAAARACLGMLKPEVVVVTNLFRDQLDRFGEVTHTLSAIREGLSKAPEAVLCLNADCSLCSSLAEDLPNRAVYFGIDETAEILHSGETASDATHCIKCKTKYEYSYKTYGHLGGFFCSQCGYSRHKAEVSVTEIIELSGDCSRARMNVFGEEMEVFVNLPAVYNIYNAVGAIAAAVLMGLEASVASRALASFKCGFGRMERFELGTLGARMMLVKNPTGCNQVVDFLAELSEGFDLVMCLNDRDADGTDVSWIWDVSFEKLLPGADKIGRIVVSGERAYDLKTRLKYAGFSEERIEVLRDYEKLAATLMEAALPIYIVPTYTSMLDFRAVLVQKLGGAGFWEG